MGNKPTVELVADNQVVPNNDDRQYRVIRLANKLEVMLVHDDDTDLASASLDVRVGSHSNPKELQGLAHFCEHLLFMGTKKYPEEDGYRQYLHAHNGLCNAYTAWNDTNYYFEVSHDALYGALDRFSQFFINPLFLEDCREREIHAVDSEHRKNLQSDVWRLWRLYGFLCNPDHVFNKFNTGNLETLDEIPKKLGLDVREELIKFYNKYYSANLMKLAVVGREPLDTLQDWVVEFFSDIANKDVPIPKHDGPLYTPEQLGRICFVKPVKNFRRLDLIFPIPGQYRNYRSRPADYVCHLLGHEGEGSYLAFLKQQGWATSLFASSVRITDDAEIIIVSAVLTEMGVDRYRDVICALFEYVQLLKHTTAHSFLFEECRILSEAQFKTRQKSPAARFAHTVANQMHEAYPRDKIMYCADALTGFEPEELQKVFDSLDAYNFFAVLVCHSLANKCDAREKHYGTEYHISQIEPDFLESLKNCKPNSSLHLPLPNEFIPWSLEIEKVPVEQKRKEPDLIRNDEYVRLWHKKDDTFWVPKANVYIQFVTPIIKASPKSNVIASLYVRLVEDAMNEFAYPAEIAGLTFSLQCSSRGLILSLNGFTDKLHVLLEKVVSSMRNLRIHTQRFANIKNRYEQELRDFGTMDAYSRSNMVLTCLTEPNVWSNEELCQVAPEVTQQDVEDFVTAFTGQFFMESLVHGNFTKEDALELIEGVFDQFQPKPLFVSQLARKRVVVLPKGSNYCYTARVPNKDDINSGIMYYIQIADLGDQRAGAYTRLMRQIMKEPTFSILRTKEQLGYIVFTLLRQSSPYVGLSIFVQSERSPVYLEHRIRALLDVLYEQLLNMPEQEIEEHKSSLISFMLEKPTNLREESGTYWSRVCDGFYDYRRLDKQIDVVGKATKQDLCDFFRDYIHYNGRNCAKLSVHVHSQKCAEQVDPVPAAVEVKNKFLFRESLGLSQAAYPVSPYEDINEALLVSNPFNV
ncbi:metallopeptidase [Schizosaccharomyces japonicus yFS275]|uniref:Metallopeptidase n=1 Tax=Schizosaccharomyces japonicus (strain yFS275 / FY16936) TaxID=402676 RepID=B6JXW8_SCHJY|nr:metallopeptidase [Schizosaccharomyces japonicus yFS275]EEB06386.1 metallopeptidase [Schizosaccharomyces japonicus yFS275]